MGTIAEKLTYLNTTKTMLRDSLNKFGSNILTTDTFRSYDTKLNEIYDKLPKVTATGQGLTISNVQNGLLDDFKMIGTDLEQNTTTGKNLFQSLITPSEFYKATYTKINDNSFSLNYTQSSTSNFSAFARIDLDISKLKPDTEYTISATNAVDGVTFSNIGALRTRINGVNGNVINSNILTFTTPNTIENVGIYFYIAYMNATTGTATITFNNIQVEEGSTATDYEPYTNGASPNPDYPQEIKVVEGRQVITDKGKNLLNPYTEPTERYGITASYNQNTHVYTFNGTCTRDNITFILSNNKINFTKQVTKSITFWVGGSCTNSCDIRHFDSNYNSNVIYSIVNISSTNNKISKTSNYTFESPINYATIRFNNGSVANNLQIKVMVTDDDNTDYEPYYNPVSYNIDLNLENIYLAKMPNTDYKNRIYKNNGNWYYERNVEKYIIDGTESWTTQSAYSGYYRYMFVLMENYKNDNLSYGVVGMNSHFIQRITQPHGDYEYLYLQAANNNLLSVYIQIKNLSTIANFKTWLSENNVVVWYVLANPVTTQITNTTLINQLEALYLHTGTNIITISNSNNIIPEIEITRLKELEKLV